MNALAEPILAALGRDLDPALLAKLIEAQDRLRRTQAELRTLYESGAIPSHVYLRRAHDALVEAMTANKALLTEAQFAALYGDLKAQPGGEDDTAFEALD